MRRFLVCAGCGWLLNAGVAAAGQPVAGWSNGESALARDASGRGVLAFGHGEHVRVATLAPSGTVERVDVLQHRRCEDGPTDVRAALTAQGHVFVTWVCFTGQEPAAQGGLGGYGFVRLPMLARWTWGETPAPAEPLEVGTVNARFPSLALAPDETAALLYTLTNPAKASERDHVRLALIAPSGPPRLMTLETNEPEPLNPCGLAVDGAGTFTAMWDHGYSYHGAHLRLEQVTSSGTAQPKLRLPVDPTRSCPTLLSDAAGDQSLLWTRSTGRPIAYVQSRPAGAAAFSKRRILRRGARLLDTDQNAAGTTGMTWVTRSGTWLAYGQLPSGLGKPIKLSGVRSYLDEDPPRVSLDDSGAGAVLWSSRKRWRAARIGTDGTLGTPRRLPGSCSATSLATASTQPPLIPLVCWPPHARAPHGELLAIP